MHDQYNVITIITTAFFSLMLIYPVYSGEIYKWQDKNGNTHFSDRAPDSAAALPEIISEPLPTEAAAPSQDTELIYLGPGSTIVQKRTSYQNISKVLDSYPCENVTEIKRLCSTMMDHEKSFYDRDKAAKQLEKIQTPCAAKALTYGLNDQQPVAESARDALLKLGSVAAAPLTDLLEDPAFSEPAKDSAAYLLSQLKVIEPQYLNRLTDLLTKGESQQQLMAARALWLNQDTALAPVWISKLSDTNTEIVKKAGIALGRLKDKNALPALLASINNISDSSLLEPLFKALVAIDPEYTLNVFSPDFYEKPPFFRKTAISAFGTAKIKSAFPIFLQSLKDNDETVKSAAIHAIGHFESPQAIERLINLLDDTSEGIVHAAEKQLKSYGLLSGAQLINALEHYSGAIRKRSAAIILENLNSSENHKAQKTLISPVAKVVDKTDLKQALMKSFETQNLPVIAGTLPFYLKEHSSSKYREVVMQVLEQYGDVGMVTTLYCMHDDPVLKAAAGLWYRKNIEDVGIQCILVPK